MHRIDGPSATPDRKFTGGSPAGGVPATVVSDAWLNDIQEELMSVLEAAGVAPEKGVQDQLLSSLGLLFASLGALPFRGFRVYAVAGTYTWDVPEGVSKAWVTVTGAGGGGSYGGGGGGGTALKLVDLTGVDSVVLTVGAAGLGSLASPSGGGSSSFGTFCSATGGGPGASTSASSASRGGSGSASGGDLHIVGGGGLPPIAGAGGGGSFWSSSALGAFAVGQDPVSGSRGGGGGGVGSSGATAVANGGVGLVVIQW
jgi:hypothetical protein